MRSSLKCVAFFVALNSCDIRRGVGVHRAADVDHQDHVRVRPARRAGDDLDLAGVAGGRVDGGGDVELVGRPLPDERPQPAQGHLELADVQRHIRPVAAVAPGVGHVDRRAPTAGGPGAQARRQRARPDRRARCRRCQSSRARRRGARSARAGAAGTRPGARRGRAGHRRAVRRRPARRARPPRRATRASRRTCSGCRGTPRRRPGRTRRGAPRGGSGSRGPRGSSR